jgi:hypothetical protein
MCFTILSSILLRWCFDHHIETGIRRWGVHMFSRGLGSGFMTVSLQERVNPSSKKWVVLKRIGGQIPVRVCSTHYLNQVYLD